MKPTFEIVLALSLLALLWTSKLLSTLALEMPIPIRRNPRPSRIAPTIEMWRVMIHPPHLHPRTMTTSQSPGAGPGLLRRACYNPRLSPNPSGFDFMNSLTVTSWQYTIGLLGLAGLFYLVFMGLLRGLYVRFFFFYLYLTLILLRDGLSFVLATRSISLRLFYDFYYQTELVMYTLTFLIVFDIYQRVFKHYPAIHRFFRLLLFFTFVILVLLAALRFPTGKNWTSMMMFEFIEHIKFSIAVLLMMIIGIIGYYRIPLDRNLSGILLGMTFYSISLIALNAVYSFFGRGLTTQWQFVSILLFLVTVAIWALTLSSRVEPIQEAQSAADRTEEYSTVVPQLVGRLTRINSRLSVWLSK